MGIYTYLKLIFDGYKKGKRIKSTYLNEFNAEQIYNKIKIFENYDRKFILFLSLFVIYKYHPKNFFTFIDKLKESINQKEEYFKFKNLLKYPYNFIKKDLEFLINNSIEYNENELLNLYINKKISMYTFYMLLKDKAKLTTSIEIVKTIDYILQYLKIKIDDNWYSSVKLKNDSLF